MTSVRVIIGSTNHVKLNATSAAFSKVFPTLEFAVESVNAPSGVAAQPFSDEETLQGALTRARGAQAMRPEAQYWVGVEGGLLTEADGALQLYAWTVVLNKDRVGRARTASFHLPEGLAKLVRSGLELSDADDAYFGRYKSKYQNGSVGILTDNVIDRAAYYTHALIFALIPFKHPEWYS